MISYSFDPACDLRNVVLVYILSIFISIRTGTERDVQSAQPRHRVRGYHNMLSLIGVHRVVVWLCCLWLGSMCVYHYLTKEGDLRCSIAIFNSNIQ